MSRALRILLIDDDENDRTLVGLALRKSAAELCCAIGAKCAIQLLEAKLKEGLPLPDLLLVDLRMPGMDGFEFLSWLKQHPKLCVLPAIAFSGSTLAEDVNRAYQFGARAYFAKTLRFEDLVERLKAFLRFWSESAQTPSVT